MSKNPVLKFSCPQIRAVVSLKGPIRPWKVEPLTLIQVAKAPLNVSGLSLALAKRKYGGEGDSHFSFPRLDSRPGPENCPDGGAELTKDGGNSP